MEADFCNLGELVGVCIEAAKRACVIIKEVESRGKEALCTTFKGDDPRSALTAADEAAQDVIVSVIRTCYPKIPICAEEDLEHLDLSKTNVAPVSRLVPEGIRVPSNLEQVELSRICLFIDPIDGTLEFVEGQKDRLRLLNVQCLIGIALDGRAVAGIAALPFHENAPVVYAMENGGDVQGLPLIQCENYPVVLPSEELNKNLTIATSKHAKEPAVKESIASLMKLKQNVTFLPVAASGNKLLQLLRGAANVSINNLMGCYWDACAYDAILKVIGGRLTDLSGGPIYYNQHNTPELKQGVLATSSVLPKGFSHDKIASICRSANNGHDISQLFSCFGVGKYGKPQALDVFRTLNGDFFSIDFLSKMVGYTVKSFTIPDTDAVKYKMSEACRVNFSPDVGDIHHDRMKSVFFKISVLRNLPHAQFKLQTAPQKLARDIRSYQVELAFLNSAFAHKLRCNGLVLPKSYQSEIRFPKTNIMDFACYQFLQDFNPCFGWYQSGLLDHLQMKCALQALAKLHAFSWSYDSKGVTKIDALFDKQQLNAWDEGSYWYPDRQDPNLIHTIDQEWTLARKRFGASLERFDPHLGKQIKKYAQQVSSQVWAAARDKSSQMRVLIHGDPKAANFFFKQQTDNGYDCLTCAMIDFQWLGWGNPCVDIAYLFASSLEFQNNTNIQEYLEFYYDCFQAELHQANVNKVIVTDDLFSFEQLEQYYQLALLDLAPIVIGYHWKSINASEKVLKSNENKLGMNAYNKNLKNAIWFLDQIVEILQEQSRE